MSSEKKRRYAIFDFPREFLVERWAPITNYMVPYVTDGYYISTYGRVLSTKSLEETHIMIPKYNQGGYTVLDLTVDDNCPSPRPKKTVSMHRLVMLAFCYYPGCENMQVNHIDGNKQNNCIWNLEWCTCQDNIQHAYRIGLMGPGRRIV